jgi:hypothetical protein
MEPIAAESMPEFIESWGKASDRIKLLERSRVRGFLSRASYESASNGVNKRNIEIDTACYNGVFDTGREYIKSLEANVEESIY